MYTCLFGTREYLQVRLFLKILTLLPDVLLDTLAHIISKRGKPQVVDSRGYKYSKERDKGLKTFWACVRTHTPVKCRARLTTGIDGKIMNCTGEHNHVPTEYI